MSADHSGRRDAAEETVSPAAVYRQRCERFRRRADSFARRSAILSWLRLGTAGAVIGSLALVVLQASSRPTLWLTTAGIATAVFAALVLVHDRVVRQQGGWRDLERINQQAEARLARDWASLPAPVGAAPPGSEALARDLQLFGPASLLHLLDTGLGPPGRETLARYLVEPAARDEILARQGEVGELMPQLELRQRLAREGQHLSELEPGIEPFLAWAEGEPWLLDRPWLVWASRLLPAVAITALALVETGHLRWSIAGLFLVLNFGFLNLFDGRLQARLDRVSAREGELLRYARALSLAESVECFGSPRLRRAIDDLSVDGTSASSRIQILHRRVVLADARASGTLHMLLGTLFLWDFQTLYLIERWQRANGSRARRWLTVLGELEALAALAGLAFDHPDWVFPAVDSDPAAALEAENLAHPLLADDVMVGNDVTVGPPGSFLLVTGSNMSGKSTLIRALGINIVLARAGGPVCASRFSMPPLRLATSILVEDSLQDGLSFFMAELLRIKAIVDAAREESFDRGRLFFLLDEILRGTNSADRQVAVREVLVRLLATGAIGAISTHDLAVARTGGLERAARPVHFRERIRDQDEEGALMTFDYRLRPGLATTSNALRLLAAVGLGD